MAMEFENTDEQQFVDYIRGSDWIDKLGHFYYYFKQIKWAV